METNKFRAWIDGKMIYIKDDIYISFFNTSNAVDWAIYNRIDGHCIYKHDSSYPEYIKNNKLIQFTGLRDKNGKDIYEGDIIMMLFSDGSKCKKIVKWYQSKCSYSIADISELKYDSMWEIWCNLTEKYLIDFQFEISNNIYENPELIKT